MSGAKGTRRPPAPSSWSEGEARLAMGKLKDALSLAGITLPSLDLDHFSSFGSSPLIALGRARPDVVEEIAEAIRRGLPT